jgi:hypothetical protein
MIKLSRWTVPLIFLLLPLPAAAQAAAPTATESPAPTATPSGKTDATPATKEDAKTDTQGSGKDQNATGPSIDTICVGTASDIGAPADPQAPAQLGAWLTLKVNGLKDLEASAKKDKKALQLYLNGLPLTGVQAVYYWTGKKEEAKEDEKKCLGEETEGSTLLRFPLDRTEASKDTWALLLGRAGRQNREIQVSVGEAGCAEGCTAISSPQPISFETIRSGWWEGYIVVLVLLLASLLLLAYRTELLHDRDIGSPWSLGRSQMAWWFFFVIAAFLYIWMVTGSYSSLSNSVLALIGISATTAVLGAVIDDNKQAQLARQAALQAERATLNPALPADAQRMQQIDVERAQMPQQQPTTHSFWRDILSDENGISFHRYQIVIWTLVLTVIFVVRVHVNLAMPDFDGQLLALMGISSGTYLGFKFPEKKA